MVMFMGWRARLSRYIIFYTLYFMSVCLMISVLVHWTIKYPFISKISAFLCVILSTAFFSVLLIWMIHYNYGLSFSLKDEGWCLMWLVDVFQKFTYRSILLLIAFKHRYHDFQMKWFEFEHLAINKPQNSKKSE